LEEVIFLTNSVVVVVIVCSHFAAIASSADVVVVVTVSTMKMEENKQSCEKVRTGQSKQVHTPSHLKLTGSWQ
jgi:hypothetical protein